MSEDWWRPSWETLRALDRRELIWLLVGLVACVLLLSTFNRGDRRARRGLFFLCVLSALCG